MHRRSAFLFGIFIVATAVAIFYFLNEDKTGHWTEVLDKNSLWEYSIYKSSQIHSGLTLTESGKLRSDSILDLQHGSNSIVEIQTSLSPPKNRKEKRALCFELPQWADIDIIINGSFVRSIYKDGYYPSYIGKDSCVGVRNYYEPRLITIPYEEFATSEEESEVEIGLRFKSIPIQQFSSERIKVSTYDYNQNDEYLTYPGNIGLNCLENNRLPVLKIFLESIIPDEPKVSATMAVSQKAGKVTAGSNDPSPLEIGIELRGFSSLSFNKKSFSIKIRDREGKDSLVGLLGLAPSAKFVLYGPYLDKSLIRNALAQSLTDKTSIPALEYRFVELCINDSYRGLYLLIEKIQVGKNHLNIPPFENEGNERFSGGVLFEIDRGLRGSHWPPINLGNKGRPFYTLNAPKHEDYSVKVLDPIYRKVFDFDKLLWYKDNKVLDQIDLESWVDFVIINEITKNIDAYGLSTFIYTPHVEADLPKFYLGPLWDFNLAFGLPETKDGYKVEGLVLEGGHQVPFYWNFLYNNQDFRERLKSRYSELRSSSLSDESIQFILDSLNNQVQDATENNFRVYPLFNLGKGYPNHYLGSNHQDEINYLLNYTLKRAAYLDSLWAISP